MKFNKISSPLVGPYTESGRVRWRSPWRRSFPLPVTSLLHRSATPLWLSPPLYSSPTTTIPDTITNTSRGQDRSLRPRVRERLFTLFSRHAHRQPPAPWTRVRAGARARVVVHADRLAADTHARGSTHWGK